MRTLAACTVATKYWTVRQPRGTAATHHLVNVVMEDTPDMELGHWVTGSMGHLGHLSRPGHRVVIFTRRETRVFPVFEKKPKIKI